MAKVTDEEWTDLWAGVKETAELFPDGIAFIGGVAVYAHAKSREDLAAMAAYSHDADMVITRADFMDLRDVEVVSTNKRLSKSEFTKRGVQYDVYVEGLSGLIVPVPEILAGSSKLDGVPVAALEHLLALKMEAHADRKGSGKGEKDAADVYRIVLCMEGREPSAARLAHLTDAHRAGVGEIRRSGAALALTEGNRHRASILNKRFDAVLAGVDAALTPSRERGSGWSL